MLLSTSVERFSVSNLRDVFVDSQLVLFEIALLSEPSVSEPWLSFQNPSNFSRMSAISSTSNTYVVTDNWVEDDEPPREQQADIFKAYPKPSTQHLVSEATGDVPFIDD